MNDELIARLRAARNPHCQQAADAIAALVAERDAAVMEAEYLRALLKVAAGPASYGQWARDFRDTVNAAIAASKEPKP